MPGDSQDSVLSTTANVIGLLTFAFSALNLWYLSTRRDSKFSANLKAKKWDQFRLDLRSRKRFTHIMELRASGVGDDELRDAQIAFSLPRVLARIDTALSLVDTMEHQWSELAFKMEIQKNPFVIFVAPPTSITQIFSTYILRFDNIFVRLYGVIKNGLGEKKKTLDIIRAVYVVLNVWILDLWWSSPLGNSKLSDQYQEASEILSEIDSHISLIQSMKILQLESMIENRTLGSTAVVNNTQPLAAPRSPASASPAPSSPRVEYSSTSTPPHHPPSR
ncbi:hypothetical protein SMACR_12811 [Sordaria macrospora]|uniref:WGS project CABT00000000 data, contig 2.7 n=2 Tax=Sordaria macrospora TaxID=5147 RepID=F7VUC3_SORMK|nr:uncharacterized protein SMAC_12811 [Sordaria macrospora k-hell]KAA8632477.1 hypothetical protein SMACR_12811 [Sordaria macrospora]KAH7630997.1 hypothetical protein B0T09DRAFT_127921 [Sordaria sp. MPI-SDFR-AT-0083]WPJ61897.1 hypothetical protein SMAC4_12811 [Sordaria macrospora]CCC09111.1 unnamed protein product [Sordaria macrospora k-hell]